MKRPVSIVILLAACGGSSHPAVSPEPSSVQIVGHDDALRTTMQRQDVALPFGQCQNGNELVVALLEMARASGASTVSDLTLHLVFGRRGAIIECETKVVFAGDPALAPPPEPAPASAPGQAEYSTEVSSFVPHASTYTTTENDLHCAPVAVKIDEIKPHYATTYDVDVARIIDEMPIDTDARVVWKDSCDMRRVTRAVTRYDFQTKLHFVPPDWKAIAARYAGAPLFETAPICYAVDPGALGAQPVHRLTATVGFRGEVPLAEPLRSPKADVQDAAARATRRR